MRFFFYLVFSLAGYLGAAAADTPKPETGRPHMTFSEMDFNFGEIKYTDVVTHDFIVTNTGTATLEIFAVQPDCGCTVAGKWDRQIEPGKTGKIPIRR